MAGPGSYLIGQEEMEQVLDVMKSGYLFRYGSEDDPNFKHKVFTFEKEFANYLEASHCVAVSSGTNALLTCLSALGIGPGDEVIVPGYTFIASMSTIVYARAIPVLAEIDESLTIDPEDIEKKITEKTKAIMPVHMLGNPCDMDKIMKIANKYNLFVIEDCCQAAGASYKGRKVGSIGDIGAFSLNVFKTITSGDGGAVITNDVDLYEKAFGFHDQGHKPNRMGSEVGNRSIIGLDFRMNELTGAVALAQVRKLDRIIYELRDKKKKLKDFISEVVEKERGVKFRQINDKNGECATLLTLIFKDKEKADLFASQIGTQTISHSGWHVYNNMEQILNKKVPTEFNCPFTCEVYGKDIEYKPHMLPKTDDILERSVNISVGVVDKGLGAPFGINILSSDEEIKKVANKVKKAIKNVLK
ncbi:MAG: DegT/DnrJ/EryC1/StrS family aminotransferase [Clostridia bacterium]|nr:DegT/DnrJ/EryC1/StrS family aminotransferase [Clostridia bacterium]